MPVLTAEETEACEQRGCCTCLQGSGHWPPEPALSCHQYWAGRKGSKLRAYLIHPWIKDRFVPAQMCTQTARLRRRGPTSQKGTGGGGRVSPDRLRKSPSGMGEEFPPFHNDPPSLQGADAQGAKGNSHPDGGHFLGSGPSHSPDPRAQCQQEARHLRQEWPPAPPERGAQIPFRGHKVTDAPCRGRSPGTPPALVRQSGSKLSLGGQGAEVGWNSGFTQRRGGDRGGAVNREGRENPDPHTLRLARSPSGGFRVIEEAGSERGNSGRKSAREEDK